MPPPALASASFTTRDDAATETLGGRFGASCEALGTRALRLYLAGDLGAGKTTFARGFLRALGLAGAVRSPTYGLFTLYDTVALPVLHADLYRLADPAELRHLGLDDHDRAGWVWLVEWPERGAGQLPAPDLEVQLQVATGTHELHVVAQSVPGADWLSRALNSPA
jgi:tRNA threonylcarbamoyladenosine biosynthesis protein TsaE